ncbi:hypothetical protein K505DRAFT_86135 [Melanomma pulvis-pyrius CBS 109.77]|uniref:Uncharacterized protein n=1 Tax=Melanomma pulvis-pyrius CBS 109.77 TaxID=1314802 RepID=A0A6A6X1E9_9PLEO|nr:hypothetical protein K505DRAFT_86135 [Melanomma pulvis-pyrius CBS 109.77]
MGVRGAIGLAWPGWMDGWTDGRTDTLVFNPPVSRLAEPNACTIDGMACRTISHDAHIHTPVSSFSVRLPHDAHVGRVALTCKARCDVPQHHHTT